MLVAVFLWYRRQSMLHNIQHTAQYRSKSLKSNNEMCFGTCHTRTHIEYKAEKNQQKKEKTPEKYTFTPKHAPKHKQMK